MVCHYANISDNSETLNLNFRTRAVFAFWIRLQDIYYYSNLTGSLIHKTAWNTAFPEKLIVAYKTKKILAQVHFFYQLRLQVLIWDHKILDPTK